MRFRSPVVATDSARPDGPWSRAESEEAGVDGWVLVVVAAIGSLGILVSPTGLGAVLVSVLGETLDVDESRTRSARGRALLVLPAIAFGLSCWIVEPLSTLVRLALVVVLAPFVYVPALLAEASVSPIAAIARSLDLTHRAQRRDQVPVLVLGALYVLGPGLGVHVWQVLEHASPLARVGGLLVAWVVTGAIALAACGALRDLARRARAPVSYRAPATRVGTLSLVALVGVVGWCVAALPTIGLDRRTDLSLPAAVRSVDGGVLLEMRSLARGEVVGLLVHEESGRWWLDGVDPRSIEPDGSLVHPVEVPLGDPRDFAAHLGLFALLVPLVLSTAWLVLARGRGLLASLRGRHALRIRFRRADVVGTRVLSGGAEMVMLPEAIRVRAASPIPIVGELPDDTDDCEASLVAPRAWDPLGTYRTAPTAPPAASRIVLGDPEDAVASARLRDFERALRVGLVLVASAAALGAVWAFS